MSRMRLAALCLTFALACGDKSDDSGADGTDGTAADGADGADGTDGTDGADGTDGTGGDNGAAVYAASCAGCHGADGTGVSAPDLNPLIPELDDASLESIIVDGKGSMPPIAVSGDDLTDLIAYLRATFG